MAKNSVAEMDAEAIAGITLEEAGNLLGTTTEKNVNDIDVEAIAKITQAEIQKSMQERKVSHAPQVHTTVKVENKFGVMALVKHLGSTPDTDEQKSAKFFSNAKGLSYYINENFMIQFNNNSFVTDDEEIINFLRSHKTFQREFWEDALPQHIIDKKRKDKERLTYEREEYN
jgi:hypothetical protein